MTAIDVPRSIEAFLAGQHDAVVELIAALVAAPSPNPPGDESAPARVALDAIARYGLPEPRIVAREPHRPNIIVTVEGAHPGPHLALCGHLDTKPAGDALAEWRTDPLVPTIDADRMYGLGTTDMKGAVAAMIIALAAIDRSREALHGSVSIILTADEEFGSQYGAYHLVAAESLAGVDAIILGEPSGIREDWEAIRTVSRGVACFKVLFTGTQMHSSVSDALHSVNAVEAMARVMAEFRQQFNPRFPPHPLCPFGPTVNIGVKVAGGVGFGVVPGHAEFWCDVRLVPGMRFDQFREDVETALGRCSHLLDGATMELQFEERIGWATATEIEPDHPAVRACQFAARSELGVAPPLGCFPGGTDAIAFQAVGGVPTIAAFGPGLLPLAHGPNEWVSCESARQAMRMYALAGIEYGRLALETGSGATAGR